MIIYIDKSIGQRDSFTVDEELMFTELACAHKRGYCYLCGETTSMDKLKTKIPLYKNTGFSQYAELGTILKLVETLVVISFNNAQDLPRIIKEKMCENGYSVRVISVSQAIEYRLNEQCVLLGESSYDCKFYRLIGEYYMHSIKNKIKGISISLKDENGGGDSTFVQLNKCVRTEHHLTFCLADSDKKHGTSAKYCNRPAIGNTASQLEKAKNSLKEDKLGHLFELYTLDVHEAENLLPLSLLDKLVNSKAQGAKPGVAFLHNLQQKQIGLKEKFPEVILCYDFKNGIDIAKLRDKSNRPQFNKKPLLAYWEEIAEMIGSDVFPPIADKTLQLALDQINASPNDFFELTVDDYLTDYWSAIGKKVFSWGFAMTPRATNPSYCA